MNGKKEILTTVEAVLKIRRLAYEIYEQNVGCKEIVLAGIQNRGYELAGLIRKEIESLCDVKVRLIAIEMDKKNPIHSRLSDEDNLDKKVIIVVDDVANSGRTLLYALHPFLNVIARKIQIAVLVDRKHKNYPVCADYVGLQISTSLDEHISVEFHKGKCSGVYLLG